MYLADLIFSKDVVKELKRITKEILGGEEVVLNGSIWLNQKVF